MKILMTWMAMLAFAFSVNTYAAKEQKDRNVAEYNLNNQGVGYIDGANKAIAPGYDPVSVFPEGGGIALKGETQFAVMHEGVEYLFAKETNMKQFLASPTKFEPTYGGYCARAMVVGQKVHINAKFFTVVDNRSFFFVNRRAKRFFDRDIAGNAKKADDFWKQISGEEPRL